MATAAEPATNSTAEKVKLQIEIPRLQVSEYHRPYVAAWIQNKDRSVHVDLAVWYQLTGSAEGHGTKWLPDLRQWWRRSGRNLKLPVDGVSGATRPVGKHELSWAVNDEPLKSLKPGDYVLVVEAAREVGGRELLELPIAWPMQAGSNTKVQGETELGSIHLTAE